MLTNVTKEVLAIHALATELKRMHDEDRAREKAEPGTICFSLTQDLDHWASCGIYTVEQLWSYLDAEFEKEVRKNSY